MNFSKNDFKILGVLFQEECNTEFKSFTKRQLSNSINLSIDKVGSTCRKFVGKNLLSEGLKNGNAKTYFITNKGIDLVKKLGGIE